jgi:streptomycin 6-kinase
MMHNQAMRQFDVPAAFAQATIAREGEAGRRWIAALPALVASFCVRWGLTPDGPAMHGYLGVVVPVRQGRARYVLKIAWIEAATTDEAAALAAWNGQGAVHLVAAEPAAGAMLLERLDARRPLATVAIGEAIPIAGRLLRRLAIPAPTGIRPLTAVAEELQHTLPERWARCGQPLSRRLLDRACATARQLAPSTGTLLVNYDLHYENVLAGKREPWLAVDPKVVAGDPEYGVAQLLWCRLEEIETQGGLDRHWQTLVEAAGLDAALGREWTLVRCVDYWLWALGAGLTEDPSRCARIVDWLG